MVAFAAAFAVPVAYPALVASLSEAALVAFADYDLVIFVVVVVDSCFSAKRRILRPLPFRLFY